MRHKTVNNRTMKTLIVMFAVCAIASAEIYDIAEDQFGGQFIMVPLPLIRHRRQTTFDISKTPKGGTHVQLGQKGTIFDDGNNKLAASGTLSKTFNPTSPLSYGGTLDYTHSSGSGLSVGATNTAGSGTDLGVQGKYNIWRDGRATLDAVGSYNRHYGGPFGTQRPNWYGGLQLSVPFGK
ncbi:hypothetical protein HHI36_009571 [Cryptolaemus montrouzieri]|uniref:Attacin C-terminal domain-containing protein n=1 Tax=Cryptolaemus montrouzieri TaxID=559131 RepID=A0ABD2MGD0_9CUCU